MKEEILWDSFQLLFILLEVNLPGKEKSEAHGKWINILEKNPYLSAFNVKQYSVKDSAKRYGDR